MKSDGGKQNLFSRVILQYVAELLHEEAQPIVSTCSVADVQAAFNTIVTRIQRLWVTEFKIFNFMVVDCQEMFTQTLSVLVSQVFLISVLFWDHPLTPASLLLLKCPIIAVAA